jgi:tetratricopeptide (TPR) repeat protein
MARHKSIAAALAMGLLLAGCKSEATRESMVPPDAKIETIKGKSPDANMHVVAGDLALNQGQEAEAIKQYQRAVILDPNNAPALFKLATICVYRSDFATAAEYWTKYLAATNDSAEGFSNLGRTYELAGNWKEAEVNYLKAIQKSPTSKAARVNYGVMLAKRDRFDEAEEQLGLVLAPAEVQYNLGSVFELRRNFDAARVAYGKAIDLDPTLLPARQRLALLKSVGSAAD